MDVAIQREQAIKEWKRRGTLAWIETTNPQWRDLYEALVYGPGFRLSPE